uniref:Uncharacterized protein n=1 Tax=Meloidogyne enterolobii TaxID=390850 RepID=A0A6V7TX67_MELEN|nr:unnamed protein product [Meloidogyne enterolobii]
MDCSAVNSVYDLNFLSLRADLKWLEPCCNIEEHREKGFLVGHCLKLILNEVCQRSNDTFNLIKCSKILCRFSAILWGMEVKREIMVSCYLAKSLFCQTPKSC